MNGNKNLFHLFLQKSITTSLFIWLLTGASKTKQRQNQEILPLPGSAYENQ